MKTVSKLILESWVHILEGAEKEYFKKKLKEMRRKKLSVINVEWFPEPDYAIKIKTEVLAKPKNTD